VHLENSTADRSGLRVPAYVIADSEMFGHGRLSARPDEREPTLCIHDLTQVRAMSVSFMQELVLHGYSGLYKHNRWH
jgi:hypothetical protein